MLLPVIIAGRLLADFRCYLAVFSVIQPSQAGVSASFRGLPLIICCKNSKNSDDGG
jgi:hypothetical protein